MTSFLSLSLPSFRVSLLSASIPCCAIVDSAPVIARPPAAVPGAGCVACRGPAPGLPTSSPMPRGPPPRAPAPFPGFSIPDGNRLCADSFASVGPSAPPGPGFHVRWPPSGPRVSARAIPVSANWRGPPAAAGVPPVSMNFWYRLLRRFEHRWCPTRSAQIYLPRALHASTCRHLQALDDDRADHFHSYNYWAPSPAPTPDAPEPAPTTGCDDDNAVHSLPPFTPAASMRASRQFGDNVARPSIDDFEREPGRQPGVLLLPLHSTLLPPKSLGTTDATPTLIISLPPFNPPLQCASREDEDNDCVSARPCLNHDTRGIELRDYLALSL